MKLKNATYKEDFLDRFLVVVKNRGFLFFAIFVAYNLFLGGILLSLWYSEVSPSRRTRMINRFLTYAHIKQADDSAKEPLKEVEIVPDQLNLVIPANDFQQLEEARSASLENGTPLNADHNFAPATIRYKDKEYSVDLHLKDERSETSTDEGWALGVKVNDDQTLMGMKRFALYSPASHSYMNEWMVNRMLAYKGLHSRKYDFISLDINGQGNRIYSIVEEIGDSFENDPLKEGPIVNYYIDLNWKDDQSNSNLSLNKHFPKAVDQLKAFQERKLKTSEVFDVNQLANFCAVVELFGSHYSFNFDNLRFYYNPSSSLFEPVIQGNIQPEILGNTPGLLGGEKQMVLNDEEKGKEGNWNPEEWFVTLFEDPFFYHSYIQALESLTGPTFLEEFKNSDDYVFYRKKKILAKGYPSYNPNVNILAVVNANLEYITGALQPVKQIHAYYDKNETTDNRLQLSIANIHNLPLEILSANIGDSIMLGYSTTDIIQANVRTTPVPIKTVHFDMPEGISWADSMLTGLNVLFRIVGSNQIMQDLAVPYSRIDEELLEDDLMRKKPNIAEFEFLEIDEQEKEVRFKTGNHQLAEALIIPKKYKVMMEAGTKVDMVNRAIILSYSPFNFKGKEESPISFLSSDSTAQGIIVLNAGEESDLQYVNFENLGHPDQSGYSVSGAVTFYESPVKFDHCIFDSNRDGDDFLNCVRTTFQINNCLFNNTNADALDSDYCKGSLTNTRFIGSGNDAIDISGTQIHLENIEIEQTADKGLSAGENSQMEGRNILIKNGEIAVTSKDLSTVTIDGIEIQDCKIAYTAFQKKSEFGPARISIKGSSTISGYVEIPYLIEDRSSMTIENKPVKSSADVDQVKRVLYGVKYGKSSK